ncbi:MAG TPA: carboxymuconolactone decarboxylase family protein [Solirubrobacteraceae bacterium]|nr:carboxymuconolactone decarboxylase family protein [Solirubrobacteraceae bacterium]
MSDEKLWREGLAMRTRVLGAEYVQSATSDPDDLFRPLQELVTEYCWGSVWTRPQLDPRTRSMLTISMLIARGQEHELKMHLKGALNNGCTQEEIVEAIVHSAIYCGVPAAISAARIARGVFTEAEG